MQGNETEEDFEYQSTYSIYDAFTLIIGILICLLNAGEIFIIFCKPSLRTVSNYLLASLAFADLFTGLIGIPLIYVCTFLLYGPVCIMSSIFFRFISISTSLHILAVTGDKYIAIVHTMRYEHYRYHLYGKWTLIFLWFLPLASSIVQLSWLKLHASPLDEDDPSTVRINVIYHLICIIVFYVGPFLVMLYAYIKIFKEVKRQCQIMKRLNPTSRCGQGIVKRNVRERRALTVFMVRILLYVLFWLPYYAVILQNAMGNEFFDLPEWLEHILYNCRFFTSLLDPILFTLGKHELQKTARQQLHGFFKPKNSRMCERSRPKTLTISSMKESRFYESVV